VVGLLGNYALDRWHQWSDSALDRRYGLDTGGVFEAADLDASGAHAADSAGYQPMQIRYFRRMMRSARLDAKGLTFIDFGSGKGRAVILAAHLPFRRVIGIEFCPSLHAAASRNLDIFRRKAPRSAPIDLVCADATTFTIPDGPLACFFYNPFGPAVLHLVLDNLRAALQRQPRPMTLLYRNPVHAAVLDASDFLTLSASEPGYRIYSASAPAAASRTAGTGAPGFRA
jgi:predicted RNA methylase